MTLLKDPPSPRHSTALDRVMPRSGFDLSGTRLAERAGWLLVWFGVLAAGITLWHFWWHDPVVAASGPLLVGAALGGMAWSWLTPSPRARVFQVTSTAAAALAALLPQVLVIATRPFYVTDSAAFEDVGGRALLHGENPYTVSMRAAARLLNVPNRYWTYTIDGGHVAHTSYPAGSFLLDVPAMVLGLGHNVVDFTDLVAWVVTGILIVALLPTSLRWLGALLLLSPVLVTMGTDAAFLPFLVLAAWRWDRFGVAGAGVARWIGPVALGLACAVKQMPWFFLPFLVIGVAMEARGRGERWAPLAGRYVAVTGIAFAAVNLPFILWNPLAWARGSVLPLVDPLVADGQGVVSLATHGITGGVDLTLLSVAGAAAYATTIAAFAVWYPVLKRLWPLLLPVAFFFATRSLSSYFIDLVPVALVAAASVSAAPAAGGDGRRLRVRGAGLVAAIALVAVSLTALSFTRAPLQLQVLSVTTSSAGRTLDTVTVRVTNDTGGVVVPHFMVNTGNNPNGFLTTAGGRTVVLRAHRSATLTLVAPAHTVAPQVDAHWLMEAYTVSPAALSTSPLVVWAPRAPH